MLNIGRRKTLAGLSAITACNGLRLGAFAQDTKQLQRGFILGTGPEGRCDDFRLGGPTVRWIEKEQRWYMWYYARDTRFPDGVAPNPGTGRIALAMSDDGIKWERYDGQFSGGAVMDWNDDKTAFDAHHVGTGGVFMHDDEWHLWYFGGDTTTPQNVPPVYQYPGYRMRPGLAKSKDGLTWTRVKGKATGGALVDIDDNIYGAFPSGFHNGEKFVIHYTTVNRDIIYWRPMVAVSEDALNWDILGDLQWEHDVAPFDAGGIITRHVISNPLGTGRKWLMIYTGLDGRPEARGRRSVSVAESHDGILWRRTYNQPIFTFGYRGAWDDGGIAYPQLVTHKDELRMYYYGFTTLDSPNPARGIGLAISTTGDLRDLRRVEL